MDLQGMENGTTAEATNNVDFQQISQTVATSIQKIHQNVSAMQRMVNQINTPQDSQDLKKELHQIMTYTHQLVSDTNNQLKEANQCKDRHLKIQRDRLIDEFTTALTSFQAVQRKTVDMERYAMRQARVNSYHLPKPPDGNNSNSSRTANNYSLFNENEDAKANQSQQMQEQAEIDTKALELQERTIRELEENIIGVNEIYKKLGAMVYEQGLAVDSIESSVEQTSILVSQGTENLRKASSYKNKVRKKKLILFGGLTVFLTIIFIIIILQFKK